MITLREGLSRIEPAGSARSVRQLAAAVGSPTSPIALSDLLNIASSTSRIVPATLTFFQQNTALLQWPLYGGAARSSVVAAIAAQLHAHQPDIVGLSEVWLQDDRDAFRSHLADLYPHWVAGPNGPALDLHQGGLLLLSRHPILQTHQTVFHAAISEAGEDAVVSKGALHAQIAPTGHPCTYHVFLSHTQSPNPELLGNTVQSLVQRELTHLGRFIRAWSGTDPAVLLGDLNTDALTPSLHTDLLSRLRPGIDVWTTLNPGRLGITIDDAESFGADTSPRPPLDAARFKSGQRLDYTLAYPGTPWLSVLTDSHVLVWETSPGRQVSDHYGVATTQGYLRKLADPSPTALTHVTVALSRFCCLTTTSGPGSDEVVLTLTCSPASGKPSTIVAPEVDQVENGLEHNYLPAPQCTLADPGAYLDLTISGKEIDVFLPNDLGSQTIRLSRALLLAAKSGQSAYYLPLLTGSGGEYAAEIAVTIT